MGLQLEGGANILQCLPRLTKMLANTCKFQPEISIRAVLCDALLYKVTRFGEIIVLTHLVEHITTSIFVVLISEVECPFLICRVSHPEFKGGVEGASKLLLKTS